MEGEIRILIVEDEFMISEDISMRLTDFGYKVSGIASSANEALTILKQGGGLGGGRQWDYYGSKIK